MRELSPRPAEISGYLSARAEERGAATLGAALLAILLHGAGRVLDTLFAWQRRSADRQALQSLDDRLLRDVGLSRADVEAESGKPFWRP